MKLKNIIVYCLAAALGGGMSSCEDFLDTMPDQRAELDSVEKIKDILVSAYPRLFPTQIFELSSDNYGNNGRLYGEPGDDLVSAYRFETIKGTSWDSPQWIWDSCYGPIAAANQALEAIEDLGTPEESLPYKAEALLCRAYGHFILANTFCMPYDAATADTHLGIPYIKAPEKSVEAVYTRGTLAEVYKNIDEDINEALKYVSDDASDVPLYHFNRRAAFAFAAKFNLFYGKPELAVEYATTVVGEEPAKSLRNLNEYTQYNYPKDWTTAFLKKEQSCNIMLVVTSVTFWGRTYNATSRYGHTRQISDEETFWAPGPWGGSMTFRYKGFGGDQNNFFPKCEEMFEVYDQTSGVGAPHVIVYAFTVDETLITRAEAYALLGEYDKCAADLGAWYISKGAPNRVYTADEISNYYANASLTSTVCKPLNPKFVTLDKDANPKQYNMVQAALHARRIETIHEGKRWEDIRRYGIQITHELVDEDPVVLKPFDSRLAIQLPAAVLSAGLQGNTYDVE